MAQIKIIGNIERSLVVSRFDQNDLQLINTKNEKNIFNIKSDYIEYYISDIGGSLLNLNLNYTDYKSSPKIGLDSDGNTTFIEIDPIKDLQSFGYTTGEFLTQYNFFRKKISNSIEEGLFIKEISPDRTELRVSSVVLTNEQIEKKTLELINEINSANYFKTYLANFNLNQQVLIVNVALNKEGLEKYEILLKLYKPLPETILERSAFWIVDEIIEPYIFEINLDKLIIPDPLPQLRGPNFDIEIEDKNTITTSYQNYNQLINDYQSSTGSYHQLISFFTSRSIDINTDYSDLSNFVKFSSAVKRLDNFLYKIRNIESYKNIISTYIPLASTTSSLYIEIAKASSSINDIIANFDGYEYYLYFESGSITSSNDYGITPYPKSGSLKPYVLYNSYSSASAEWYTSSLSHSIQYDLDNLENLENTIPAYIREDDINQPYFTFVNMIGHYFDNIWIYIKSFTDLYKSSNNLESGVSKDLVYYALKSLGIKTYNSKENESLLDYIVGQNSGSSNFDENFTSTGSYLNNIPRQDLVAESLKRIYHNVSILFKSKGTKQGLDLLSNIFGVSSSILDIKEFGGLTKKEYLKGYSTNKINISSESITGSVLSPFISVIQEETASSNFKSIDLHKVDIAFSPQNQIDTAISASISSSYPTFNIDDYIGDPRDQYSSSYSQLVVTGSSLFANTFDYAFDYSGFIRLAKFFDNSLFKTFKDFNPARNNLSTGIVIRSPQLERIKIQSVRPNFYTESIYEATYSIASISESNDYLYPYLSGDKAAFYTGELPMSISSINDYFTGSFPNPYLINAATVTLPTLTGSNVYSFNDRNTFEHTDFNVLLNNVSGSRKSTLRKKLEPIYINVSGTLKLSGYSSSYFAELQDSNESLRTYQLSRYEGVKTTSLRYNTHTSASASYQGDVSYGKTAAIDKHVKKIGIFGQIVENKFLPHRNNVALKYLIDKEGELTELNQRNKHWEEVQRTFISGDTLDVSLFDNQKYGNQKLTDGTKDIFDSGYSYYPILYFASCSGDYRVYFENLGGSNAYLGSAVLGSASLYISGSGTDSYPLVDGNVYNIFDYVLEGSEYLEGGNASNYPSYSINEAGDHRVYATLGITVTMPDGGNSTWGMGLYKNGSLVTQVVTTLTIASAVTASGGPYNDLYSTPNIGNPTITQVGIVTSNKEVHLNGTSYPVGTQFRKWSVALYKLMIGCSPNAADLGTTWYSLVASSNSSYTSPVPYCTSPVTIYNYVTHDFWEIPNLESTSGPASYTFTIDRGLSLPVNGAVGDTLSVKFQLLAVTGSNFTASFNDAGSLSISSLSAVTGYASTVCPFFSSSSLDSASLDTGSNDEIIFSAGISNFHNRNYLFVPNPLTGSENSLYNHYGDVDYPFIIKPYDIVLTYLSDGTYVESRILNVYRDSNNLLRIKLQFPLSNLMRSDLANPGGTYQRFLLLTRVPDETNAHLRFRKRPGPTSYGLSIPSNIHPEVLDNINIITEQAKKKLLELGGIDGGVL